MDLLDASMFSSSFSSLSSSGELITGSSCTRFGELVKLGFGELVKLGWPVDDGFELVFDAHVVVVDELESMRSVPFSMVSAVLVPRIVGRRRVYQRVVAACVQLT